jgi:hypothetical protein
LLSQLHSFIDAKNEILKIMKETIEKPREGQKENGPVTGM